MVIGGVNIRQERGRETNDHAYAKRQQAYLVWRLPGDKQVRKGGDTTKESVITSIHRG